MATVESIVKRALVLCKVQDANEPVQAAYMDSGIQALNAMLTRWEASGTAMGWVNVDNPSDTMPSPPEADEAIAYQLALRLNTEFGGSMGEDAKGMAMQFYNDILRDRAVEMPLRQRPDTPLATAAWWRGNYPW